MPINPRRVREYLDAFQFKDLFIQELGWSLTPRGVAYVNIDPHKYTQIADLAGVAVLEVSPADGRIPDAKTRKSIYDRVTARHHENLLIFVDEHRTQSLWYWVKRDGVKKYPREHWYFKGQPGDLFLSKLSSMVVDISEFEQPDQLTVVEAANRLRKALDVEPVTKKFYTEFRDQHIAFLQHIHGINDEHDRRWYASVLLNRLMFIYFLQGKGFLDNGDYAYLQHKLDSSQQQFGDDAYYSTFLDALFFEGFAKLEGKRDPQKAALVGTVPYLNGGLFLKHPIEVRWPNITIPDVAFRNLFKLFSSYSWNLDDTPGGKDDELNPDVLGYIFEKYINQKAFGAYYTRTEITDYLCEQTIHRLILDRINRPVAPGAVARQFESLPDMLMELDAQLCRDLLNVLPTISLLDPACGSGAFLVAAMKTLINIYSAVTGRIEFLNDAWLTNWLDDARLNGKTLNYTIKKQIITNNLFGVDIMEEATEIAKLRLFLALVSSVRRVDDLEPLPNIDFNILPGNSLIGLLHVNAARLPIMAATGTKEEAFQRQLDEKNRKIAQYRDTTKRIDDPVALQALRDEIQQLRAAAQGELDGILLEDFYDLGIKYEQATWDVAKGQEGKPTKRPLVATDIQALHPFHWGYEFDQVMEAGGFDAIITNPPWEIFKPQAKEFFQEYSALVTKNKMTIKEFEEAQAQLLRNPEIRAAWLQYQSRFPHLSTYYRSAPQYKNQVSVVNGKKAGSDLNLYKSFVEQCYNLLRDNGQCGIVIPSGIYTDLGSKQLRELLFGSTQVTGLFGFENRKIIFEGVDSRFKFVVLTFEKGGYTETFPSAFMRHKVEELDRFPSVGALEISVDLIARLSPNSLSVMEFKTERDVQIAEKMLAFPLLNAEDKLSGGWNFEINGEEFHMNRSAGLFKQEPTPTPLYEGGMIWHFDHTFTEPRFWIDELEVRSEFKRKRAKRAGLNKSPSDIINDYETERIAIRKIASSTNERTLITTIIPSYSFTGNSLATHFPFKHDINEYNIPRYSRQELFLLVALMNSFVVDYILRSRMTTNLNSFYVYQLPLPRLAPQDPLFIPIVQRAARLICTTPEFDNLAKEVGIGDHTAGITDVAERAELRAELDGMIAHIYGLTGDEFRHILATFPLVAQEVKDAALAAYHTFAPNPDDAQVAALIAQGESAQVEFKVAALINPHTGQKDGTMAANIVQSVASYLNSYEGGSLLIGVKDNGNLNDLHADYLAANPQKNNRDGYALWLSDTLGNQMGNQFMPYWTITFHHINGHDVCRIGIKPAPQPVYLKNGDFYVRGNQGKKKLTVPEAIAYIQQRWR
jgi:hypothetical protein